MLEIFNHLGGVLAYASIPTATFVSVVSYFLTQGCIRRRSGAAVCFFLATFTFMTFAGFSILSRGGIHPDAVFPTDTEGLVGTAIGIGLATLIAGFFVSLGWFILTNQLPSAKDR